MSLEGTGVKVDGWPEYSMVLLFVTVVNVAVMVSRFEDDDEAAASEALWCILKW